MRGLWLEDKKLDYRDNIPMAIPTAGEALIRVIQSGICQTDIEMVKGYYPFTGVIGHEFVGIVEESQDPSWLGKRVCGEINVSCGQCELCRRALYIHCTQRTVLGIWERNGSFAEYLSLPTRNLHVVPDNVYDDQAVFAEPLAAAVGIAEQVSIRPTDRVVVIGSGKLGNMIAQSLVLSGADMLVIGNQRSQLELLERRGIRTGFQDAIQDHRADVVVECTGNPAGFELACKAVRPRGTIVMKSTFKGQTQVNFSPLVVDEVSLIGSRSGPIGAALRLLAQGVVDVHPLIETRLPLSRALEAFELAQQPGKMKIILQMTGY
jgi:threonine dehydrogenase-like Zn-dependent dehydrogenase